MDSFVFCSIYFAPIFFIVTHTCFEKECITHATDLLKIQCHVFFKNHIPCVYLKFIRRSIISCIFICSVERIEERCNKCLKTFHYQTPCCQFWCQMPMALYSTGRSQHNTDFAKRTKTKSCEFVRTFPKISKFAN